MNFVIVLFSALFCARLLTTQQYRFVSNHKVFGFWHLASE